LRLDSHGFSPTISGKIVGAAARTGSFAAAAESLNDEAEVTISDRQVGRIAHEVGDQLRDRRDRRVEASREKSDPPEVSVAPRLAAVFVDGGRLRTRTEGPGQGAGVHDPAWREDKVANLLTMHTEAHEQDPHPQLPKCFTKKREVVELIQGIAGQGALADVTEPGEGAPPALTVFEPAADEKEERPRWPPEPLVRTCQATMASSEAFGPMVAAEARRRNFFAAQARAFLGDGGAWIWTLQRTYFPTFEPIVDFVHVLTYIYLAAKAVGDPAPAVWERYLGWAKACWQGRVAAVLEELRAVLGAMAAPSEGQEAKPTDPYEILRVTIGYLANNEGRMDYPRYRRAGLPTCSGLVESLIKQFNRRVKGTEKFWNPTSAETILQLRAAYLSEDDRLAKAIGRNYFTCSSVAFGLMVMSYFGRVAERSSRASYCFISLAGTRTPSGYTPGSRFTVGCRPFHFIRRAHCRTTFRPFSNSPFHFCSSADQHRSIGLYLLWYGG
jgi:hypothetical protein